MFSRVQDLKVYYEWFSGDNHSKTFLLLHGWGTDSRSMRPIFDFLKQTDQPQIYAPDFPGFGLSDTPPHSWDVSDYVMFIRSFLNEHNLEQVHIIAHSFGGRVGIKLSALHPENVGALVLIDSAGIRPNRTINYYFKVYLAKLSKKLAALVPDHSEMKQRLLARFGSEDYRAAGEMRDTFVRVVNEDLRHHLPHITSPTLLIWGEQDTATPPADGQLMNQLIPHSRLAVLQGAGHYSYMDNLTEFKRNLSTFLQDNHL